MEVLFPSSSVTSTRTFIAASHLHLFTEQMKYKPRLYIKG
jgi:hypothetical protein